MTDLLAAIADRLTPYEDKFIPVPFDLPPADPLA